GPSANQPLVSAQASIFSGQDQLPPPAVSGPTVGWGSTPLPSALPGVQPNSRTAGSGSVTVAEGGAGASGTTPGFIRAVFSEDQPQDNVSKPGAERMVNGAVRQLVSIVNGGVRMSSTEAGALRWVSSRR